MVNQKESPLLKRAFAFVEKRWMVLDRLQPLISQRQGLGCPYIEPFFGRVNETADGIALGRLNVGTDGRE